jgi:hypothetical protein
MPHSDIDGPPFDKSALILDLLLNSIIQKRPELLVNMIACVVLSASRSITNLSMNFGPRSR